MYIYDSMNKDISLIKCVAQNLSIFSFNCLTSFGVNVFLWIRWNRASRFFFCFLLVLYTLSILLSKLFTTTKFAVFSVCPACVLSSTSGRCTWQFSGFYISESFVAICLFTISNLLTWKNLGLMGELILFCCVLHGSMSILRNRS